jgi:hypothetical protein
MAPMQRIVTAMVLVAAVAACSSDSTDTQTASCTNETTSVEPTISVVFDWKPACAVALVLVETDSGHDMWWVATFDPESDVAPTVDANRIATHVSFGDVPSTATHSYGPDPLIAGKTYTLALWRVLPKGSTLHCLQNVESNCLLAVKTFTR